MTKVGESILLGRSAALVLALAASLAAAGLAEAKPGDKGGPQGGPKVEQGGGQGGGQGQGGGSNATQEKPSIGDVIFDEIERRLIGDYYRQNPYIPDAKVKSLPPGIQMKLARGGTLPPGIAKRFLPGELEGRLPRRTGYERVIHGEDVYLIQQGTGLILDVLEGVLRGAQR